MVLTSLVAVVSIPRRKYVSACKGSQSLQVAMELQHNALVYEETLKCVAVS